MAPDDPDGITQQLARLRGEHRELDQAIVRLHADIASDELALKRMKRRKLQLRDAIARLESAQIPDEPA
ncbi:MULTISPECIES: YdcH family protein [unclassified Luteimonas]